MIQRKIYSTGGKWEEYVGYSRAVRVGNIIEVAGTTATLKTGEPFCLDAYGQTLFILEQIEKILKLAGSSLSDVVRTRMYVTDISQWDAIGKAHGVFFSKIRPASTMVGVNALIDPRLLVEIEVSAIIPES